MIYIKTMIFIERKLMKRLDKHSVIAWDFDETLIENPNSFLFWDYIANNQDKDHWIITFRNYNSDAEIEIWNELYNNSSGMLSYANFKGVRLLPDDFYIYPNNNIKEWKGKTASELGCTVIVDDLTDYVEEGAIKHNVEFIDSYSAKRT